MADLTHIWASPAAEVDADAHEQALRAALSMDPGQDRDDRLAAALADEGELLADEPYADWALRPRERLEALRQEARLALARDRAKEPGDPGRRRWWPPGSPASSTIPPPRRRPAPWSGPTSRTGDRELAVRAYERCRAALDELGLRISPWLEEVYATAAFEAAPTRSPAPVRGGRRARVAREELRTVTVLSAEVAAPAGLARSWTRRTCATWSAVRWPR